MKLEETLSIIQEELKPSLTKHCYGILTYGSAARRKDFIPRWSDVDILIASDYDFECPKEFYSETADWYTRIREKMEKRGVNWGIEDEVGFSLYDIGSITSGRLCWMLPSFKEHLMRSARVLWGGDFRGVMSDEYHKANEEAGVAYSLWRTRVAASTLDYNERHDERQLKYDFKKSTKALGNFFRDAVVLEGGKLREDTKPGIAEQFVELFPKVNAKDVKDILTVPSRWPNVSHNEMEDLFFKGLRIREVAVGVLTKDKRV